MTALQVLAQVQAATNAARAATGMNGVGTRVSGGLLQVVNVTMRKGRAPIIDPLSGFVPASEAIRVLRAIESDKGFN